MTLTDSKKRAFHKIKHPSEFLEFIEWFALPDSPLMAKTQRELAEKLGVGEDTLSEWKQRDGFYDLVNEYRRDWARRRTAKILGSFFDKTVNDANAPNVKLWFQLFEGWSEKKSSLSEVSPHKCIPILSGEIMKFN